MKTNLLAHISPRNIRFLIIASVSTLFISSCSVKKYIPEGEQLYSGAELKINYPEGEKRDKELNSALQNAVYPKPNSKFLGMRIGLWAHYKSQSGNPWFLTRYINKRYGEDPVYLSAINTSQTEDLLQNRAENRGFFFPTIKSSTFSKKNKGGAVYEVNLGRPYRLMSYQLIQEGIPELDSMLQLCMKGTDIKTNSKYRLASLTSERKRIDRFMKNKGYYYFNSEFLLFKTDTNQYDERRFDLYLTIKDDVDRSKLKPFTIGRVQVFSGNSSQSSDSIAINGVEYYQSSRWVEPQYLDNHIIVEPDSLYRLQYARNTTRRLSGLDAFRHANIRFTPTDSSGENGVLDARIVLNEAKKFNLRTGTHAYTKSTGFAGPGLVMTFQDRNIFHGAEVLEVRGVAGYEFQISRGTSRGLNNFEFRLENSLSFPRLLAPFIKFNPYRVYAIPNSRIHLNFNYQQRALYYSVDYFYTALSYDWYTSAKVRWELIPLSLNYMRVYNRTEEFEEILDDNPFLARSFDDQFIPAIGAKFNFNEMTLGLKKNRVFLSLGLEQAGFLTGITTSNDSLLGQPFAQYVKSDIDLRYNIRLGKDKNLVNRVFVGVGVPYGTSQSLPYIKQYYSGGPNSVRAFPVRSLGPGSFVPEQIDDNSFFDQAGDIRVELNTEYRFPIISYLKGALFIDAGNIWLYNDNPSLPGAKFSSEWYKEMAIGGGIGLRFDVQVVVVRMDVAHPLRYPSSDFRDFWNTDYDFSKLVWNFAIGYPF